MHTLKTTTIVSAALFSLLLSACGGGSSSPLNPVTSSSLSVSSSSVGVVDTTSPRKLGVGSGSSFIDGAIGVGIGSNTLSAGGSTALTVNVVSSTNTLVTNALEITFNSSCVAANKAQLTNPAGNSASRVTTNNGQASITYTAKGCKGPDLITATTSIDGKVATAQITLTIEADTVGSIKFVDADPLLVSLAGTGGDETSIVRFQVLGSTNAPISDEEVTFGLDISPGGLKLTNTTAKTDSNGYASTTVNAGTVATAVRVTATAVSKAISAQSSRLIVSTGIPDQDSMSLSATTLNPSAWNFDGETVDIHIRMADAFNNLAPDGTAVSFITEGGAIASGCTTTGGTCTVKWVSQSPRPTNGRVTILATAVGNESFTDTNSNGQYDFGEPFDDLGEAFLDANENGIRDSDEFYVNVNDPSVPPPPVQVWDAGNGLYNGVLCKNEGQGCTRASISVRDQLVLVMSSDDPRSTNGLLTGQPGSVTMVAGQTSSFVVTLQDVNGNAMPIGTTVSINSASASDVTVTHTMPTAGVANTTSPINFTVTMKASDTKAPSGNFSIEVKSPRKTTSFITRFQ
jgi:hypothetical protein